MNEWTVITVLVALVGLFASVGKPVIKLTNSITKLNLTVDNLSRRMGEQERELGEHKLSAHESHKRLWDHNDRQDERINAHEKRLDKLEG